LLVARFSSLVARRSSLVARGSSLKSRPPFADILSTVSTSTVAPPHLDVFVARQPVFNRRYRLVGYHLLYRAAARAAEVPVTYTGSDLLRRVADFGLEALTGGARAFVGLTRDALLAKTPSMLPHDRWTLELPRTTECDAQAYEAAVALKRAGYTLVLDDRCEGDAVPQMLQTVHVVKVDVHWKDRADIEARIARIKPAQVQLLADRIEDADTHSLCRDLGFDLFRGAYFSAPEVVERDDLPTDMIGVARLMNLVADDDVHEKQIEDAFLADPRLSFKLLRIANSAAYGRSGIETIGQAVRLVGRGPLHKWLAMLLVTSAPQSTGVDSELLFSALQRGWLCEKMANNSGRPAQAGALFLAGLLSNFDAILGLPMDEMLRQVRVSPEVEAALLHAEGPFTPYVDVARSFVDGDFDKVEELASLMGVADVLPGWFAEAGVWARGLVSLPS
jgi:EAL and modified HD-GYP domain-containing signal transduction protein